MRFILTSLLLLIISKAPVFADVGTLFGNTLFIKMKTCYRGHCNTYTDKLYFSKDGQKAFERTGSWRDGKLVNEKNKGTTYTLGKETCKNYTLYLGNAKDRKTRNEVRDCGTFHIQETILTLIQKRSNTFADSGTFMSQENRSKFKISSGPKCHLIKNSQRDIIKPSKPGAWKATTTNTSGTGSCKILKGRQM